MWRFIQVVTSLTSNWGLSARASHFGVYASGGQAGSASRLFSRAEGPYLSSQIPSFHRHTGSVAMRLFKLMRLVWAALIREGASQALPHAHWPMPNPVPNHGVQTMSSDDGRTANLWKTSYLARSPSLLLLMRPVGSTETGPRTLPVVGVPALGNQVLSTVCFVAGTILRPPVSTRQTHATMIA
jgi:hypothetical protein